VYYLQKILARELVDANGKENIFIKLAPERNQSPQMGRNYIGRLALLFLKRWTILYNKYFLQLLIKRASFTFIFSYFSSISFSPDFVKWMLKASQM